MLRKLRRRAASGPEYALLIALIAVVALGSIVSLGTEVSRVLGRTAEASYDSVADGPVWVTPPGSLGAIAQTVPFQFQFEATDLQGRPLTYGLKSGSLPDGITLSASGLLSGTVVGNSGLWSFVVEATNDAGKSAAQGFALTIDNAPLPFFFPDDTNLVPGSAVVSAAITPGGFATAQPVTVSGPSNPKLSIAGADLDSFSGTLQPGETLALRATAPPDENETETVAVQIGPTSGSWTLKTGDSTPDPFGFGTTDNADTLIELVSSAVAPTGYSLPVSVSVTGAGNPLVSIDNGPFAAAGTLHPGQTIQIKATTPATQNSAAMVRVFAGPTRGDWTIRTGDNTPEPFTLSSGPAGVTAGGIEITAPETTPSSYTVPNLPWTVTGGLASVDGGPFASSGTISPGQSVVLRSTTPAAEGGVKTVTMAINGVANVWTITAADPNPGNDFVYQATSGTSGQTVVTADSWTPTGYNVASAWTVTNGQGSTDSGATWSASGQIAPGQSLKLRATVPAAFATTTVTAKIGTATGTWAVSGPSSLKVVFGYTGGWQTQTVPAGASTVTVKAWGAAGGSMQANGGGGGFAQATLSVTPGETLSILVGEGGCGYRETCSPFGGGGGGYFASGGGRSAVRRGSTELVTAGGGGGGGAIDPQSGSAAHGGAGGGTTGQASTPYSEANGCCSAGSAGGGTQTAGGAGATGSNTFANPKNHAGFPGSAFQGGNGTNVSPGGTGGGGGWYGGGGGTISGGGGGGSSHVPAGGTTIAGSGPNPGNASDPDYGGNAGRAFAGQRGAHGRVVLIFN